MRAWRREVKVMMLIQADKKGRPEHQGVMGGLILLGRGTSGRGFTAPVKTRWSVGKIGFKGRNWTV